MIKKAGEARQARFNVDIIHKVIMEYYRRHKSYPEDLHKLPKFYVVSAMDKLYFESSGLNKDEWQGYRYHFQLIGKDKFVLSASPVEFWKAPFEFGITEKGILKSNDRAIDVSADSYEEVDSWKATGGFDRIKIR